MIDAEMANLISRIMPYADKVTWPVFLFYSVLVICLTTIVCCPIKEAFQTWRHYLDIRANEAFNGGKRK